MRLHLNVADQVKGGHKLTKIKLVSKGKRTKNKNAGKIQNANIEKKALMFKRLEMVRQACEDLVDDGLEVNYTLVSEKTDIPKRTLERSYYKDLIARYRTSPVAEEKVSSPDVESLKNEVEYLRGVATKWENSVKKLLIIFAQKGIITQNKEYMSDNH